jgi:uncharacterized protein (DUF1919 family)
LKYESTERVLRVAINLLNWFRKKEEYSIISNNHIAEEIYKDMGMPFRSPTIGLWFDGNGFLDFVKDVRFYSTCELLDVTPDNSAYPVGELNAEDGLHASIKVHFAAYSSFQQAKDCWKKRFAQVDYDHICYIFEFNDDVYDCSWVMSMYSALPGRTISLTHKPHPEIIGSVCIADGDQYNWKRFNYRDFFSRPISQFEIPIDKMTEAQRSFVWGVNAMAWNNELRSRNRNTNPTILTCNCLAGFIYHNLGLMFRSPIINLFLMPWDFCSLATNLKAYADSDMVEVSDSGYEYPVGRLIPHQKSLPELTLYFQHYHSFDEAKSAWFRRYARINYDNIYVILEFNNIQFDVGEYVDVFASQKFPGKSIALLHKPDPRFPSSFVLTCGPADGSEFPSGYTLERDGITGKRRMDNFDYVSFLNS